MSKSVQLRSSAASPLIGGSGKGRRSARSTFTKSVLLDNEDFEHPAHHPHPDCNPLTKTFSEQNVFYSPNGPQGEGPQDFSPQLPYSCARNNLTPKPRPVSCYSAEGVNAIPTEKKKNNLTQMISNSKIPRRIIPTINPAEFRSHTYNLTNPSIELAPVMTSSTPALTTSPSPQKNQLSKTNGSKAEQVSNSPALADKVKSTTTPAKDRPRRQGITSFTIKDTCPS